MLTMDIERLKSLLKLNPETGELTWIKAQGRAPKGSVAGHRHKATGYLRVKVDNKLFLAHRLVWALHYGYWPKEILDHRSRVKTDNRPENLRRVTNSQNQRNAGLDKRSTTGVTGVTEYNGRFIARMTINGKKYYLGSFKVLIDAVKARKAAELQYNYMA